MFRSVANLIAHKRSYCRNRLQDVKHVYRRDPGEYDEENAESMATAFVQPEPVETLIPDEEWDLEQYSPSMELLKEAGLIQEIEQRPLVDRLWPADKKPSLDCVVSRLKWKLQNPEWDFYSGKEEQHVVQLERMAQTDNAMFQVRGNSCSEGFGRR